MPVDPSKLHVCWRLCARLLYERAIRLGRAQEVLDDSVVRRYLEIRPEHPMERVAEYLTAASAGHLTVTTNSGSLVVECLDVSGTPAVREVYDHWRSAADKKSAKLNDSRRRRIKARLGEGYTVADCCEAISGALLDPFMAGQNDRGKVYDSIETILRDGSTLERHRETYRQHVRTGRVAPSIFAGR